MRVNRDNLIALGVVVVVTVAYLLVVYRGQSATMGEIEARAAECRESLAADSGKAAPIPHMVREIEAMKLRYDKDWNRRLPQRQELAGFLREISENLSEAGLRNDATVIEPGKPSRGPLYNRLPISMKSEGDFLVLAGFLGRVDNMARLTRIEQLSITPKGPGEGLRIEVGMNIYYTEQ